MKIQRSLRFVVPLFVAAVIAACASSTTVDGAATAALDETAETAPTPAVETSGTAAELPEVTPVATAVQNEDSATATDNDNDSATDNATDNDSASDADADGSDPYRLTVSLALALDGDDDLTRIDDLMTVDIDRANDTALIETDFSVVPERALPDWGGGLEWVAYVDGRQLMRGFDRDRLGWIGEGEPDPDVWYLGRTSSPPGIPDVVPAGADAAALFAELGVTPDDTGTALLSFADVAALDDTASDLFADLNRMEMSTNGPLALTITDDELGRVGSIRIELDRDDEGPAEVMSIDVTYGIDPFDVPSLDDARSVPGVETDPERMLDNTINEALSGATEVAMRLNVYLGRDNLDVVLTPENVLVRVGRTDIYAGPDDFVQWQLTRAGSEELLRAVLENPVVASGEYNVYFPIGVGLDIGAPPSELNASPSHSSESSATVDYEDDIDALIELLDDPSWLGDEILRGPEPWIPTTLTVEATPQLARSDAAAWPLATGIRETGRPSLESGDTIVICLEGDDVAPVWALLGDGANYAHLAVDDGESWRASVSLNWPGYRLFSDPCGPTYERYLDATGIEADPDD